MKPVSCGAVGSPALAPCEDARVRVERERAENWRRLALAAARVLDAVAAGTGMQDAIAAAEAAERSAKNPG